MDQGDFQKDFFIQNETSEQISIHLKAFRKAELWVNEFPIPLEFTQNWKEGSRGLISPWLKQGANTIRVMVNNPLGPALLWMKVEGLDPPVRTDETWKVRFESDPYVQAILADDTRANPESLSIPTPLQSLSQKWVSLLLIFGLTIVLFGAAPLLRKIGERESLPRIALLAIFGAWIYLFGEKMVKIGPDVGFDVGNHLAYILYIFQNQRIPLPTEGWSMFHPPFFYLLSADFLQIMEVFFPWDNLFPFLKIIPLLCGMGNIWVSYSLLRLVFPDDRARILGGVILAGFLPMNIYISAYVGNEPLHAFLAGCSLVMAVHILRSSEVRSSHMIYLGLLLGLAMLTKITAGALVPVVVIFFAYKMIRVDGKNLKEVASRLGFFILVMTVISGWYYIRNIIHFGRPFMINWDLPGQRWWQDPGFHTVQYYLSFGEALRHPYFSAFHSFWDALYSTFWGDGLIGGKALIAKRPDAWNYDYMSAVYLLALPAAGIFLLGLLKAVQMALKDKDPSSKLIMAFLIISFYSVALFILFSTLKVPIYGQAKAFYFLAAMAPITVFGALGFGVVRDWLASSRLIVVRALFYGWLGTLLTSIYLSFTG